MYNTVRQVNIGALSECTRHFQIIFNNELIDLNDNTKTFINMFNNQFVNVSKKIAESPNS